MKIILVRHGETESNYKNICQGISNVLLNDTGRRQSQKLREKIKNKHFDICYTSPLVRAVETAMILIGDRIEMIPDKRIIDRNLGELEGKSRDLYDACKYWDYELNCGELGVECVQDIFKRCSEFINYVLEKHSGKDVLIVSHAAVIRVIKHILSNSSFSEIKFNDVIKNCYYEEIEIIKK